MPSYAATGMQRWGCFSGLASVGFGHQPVLTARVYHSMELPELRRRHTVSVTSRAPCRAPACARNPSRRNPCSYPGRRSVMGRDTQGGWSEPRAVEDPRSRKNELYPLEEIVLPCIFVAGSRAGRLLGIEKFGRDKLGGVGGFLAKRLSHSPRVLLGLGKWRTCRDRSSISFFWACTRSPARLTGGEVMAVGAGHHWGVVPGSQLGTPGLWNCITLTGGSSRLLGARCPRCRSSRTG